MAHGGKAQEGDMMAEKEETAQENKIDKDGNLR